MSVSPLRTQLQGGPPCMVNLDLISMSRVGDRIVDRRVGLGEMWRGCGYVEVCFLTSVISFLISTFSRNHSIPPLMREFGLQGMVQGSYDNNYTSSPSALCSLYEKNRWGFGRLFSGPHADVLFPNRSAEMSCRPTDAGGEVSLAEPPISTRTLLTSFDLPHHMKRHRFVRGVSACCGGR